MSVDVKADALVGNTQSGYTGFMLSSFRPRLPYLYLPKPKA